MELEPVEEATDQGWKGWGAITEGFTLANSIFQNRAANNQPAPAPSQNSGTVWYVLGGVIVLLLIVFAIYKAKK